ncbi:N-acetyltransferase GCN5 [Lentibacillus jeotgali]|uniref:N-acetyltransferase GCN5 n=1 Tax=Lentibacillus jeotgali TaxID=558169 RepID=UPI000262740D|nr:N-acetyltransferase GCN5 [Lentibacillus jeotgali]
MLHIEDNTDVGRKLTRANRILVETAVRKGVTIKKIPGKSKRFRMIYGNDNYLIKRGYIFSSYNNKLALRLCKRKNVISNYLRTKDIPVPANVIFNNDEVDRAWDWAKYSLPIVLKPNDGKSGKMVYVNIDNKEEFYDLFNRIANEHDKVLVEEFKKGTDYRVVVVKNKIVTALKRIPANVLGDGKSSIKELVNEKNKKWPSIKTYKIRRRIRKKLIKSWVRF